MSKFKGNTKLILNLRKLTNIFQAIMEANALYKDNNLEVYSDHLLLKNYYFLKFGQKKIAFSEIESFQEIRLTYFNGMSRHEHTWLKPRWPFDWKCKHRTEAVYLKLRGARVGIGIAAEEPKELSLVLHKNVMAVSAIVAPTEQPAH